MSKIIAIGEGSVLLEKGDGNLSLPDANGFVFKEEAEVFSFDSYKACSLSQTGSGLPQCVMMPVRDAWNALDPQDYAAVVKGAELLNWNQEERFCAADGTRLERNGEISKICPVCGREYFPRLFPAIVVLVKRGDEALLVHGRNLRKNIYALVAGFVETGESLEECVAREVREEADLEIDNIKYVGSQAWPFPHQLMVGFTASYKSGELRFADGELTSGGFFSRENCPPLPTHPSLSRKIIDDWVNGML